MTRSVVEERKDKAFLVDANQWPRWPLQTIKRYHNHDIECGVVAEGRWTVYLVNVFALSNGTLKDLLFDNKEVKRIEYPTVDELLAAGWMVD